MTIGMDDDNNGSPIAIMPAGDKNSGPVVLKPIRKILSTPDGVAPPPGEKKRRSYYSICY